MFELFGFVILFILLFLFYNVTLSFRKLSFLNNKKKIVSWCLSLIPIILIFSIFNIVNSIVIIFHYEIMFVLVYLVMVILKKKNNNWLVIISTLLTIVYLGYGAYQDYHIYETKYDISINKINYDFNIIQISDTHIGTTFDGNGFKKHIEKISKIDSDLFVITGDFIDDDTSKKDMIDACNALSMIKSKYGVYFINGNHDKGYYNNKDYSYDDFINELEKNNVIVLKDEVVNIDDNIVLVGREDKQYPRKSINELVNGIDKTKYIIDLNHQPNDYENEKGNVDLVLSGHTHGGQLLPLGYIGLLMNANDSSYGLKKLNNTNFIVNSGMSDWAIDFKTGTFSEYVIIKIHGDINE